MGLLFGRKINYINKVTCEFNKSNVVPDVLFQFTATSPFMYIFSQNSLLSILCNFLLCSSFVYQIITYFSRDIRFADSNQTEVSDLLLGRRTPNNISSKMELVL